jgi:predicted glycosyltransferase involved in capsule biosynthesis
MLDLQNISDNTFLFPVRLDTIERLENTLAATQFLVSSFETNIMVSEYSAYNNGLLERLLEKSIQYVFHEDHDLILFRTKFLNEMTHSVTTPFVAIWDTDVIVPKNQVFKAMEMLRNGVADFVYPYESYFFDTTPLLRKLYFEGMDINVLEQNTKKMKAMYSPNPVGGAFMANRQAYVYSGLENENFYGWGLEDGERYYRWLNQGYRVKRVHGPLFHLSHGRGINSTYGNPDQQLVKRKEVIRVKRNTTEFQ